MATWVNEVTTSSGGNISLVISGGYQNVSRNGTSVSFNWGVRFKQSSGTYTYNSIAAFPGGTLYYAVRSTGGSSTASGTWYYSTSTSTTVTKYTAEAANFSWSGTVPIGTNSVEISVNVGWDGWVPTQKYTYKFTVPLPAGTIAPSWTTYSITSVPSTAYVNMQTNHTVNLGCNYGTYTPNLLYWEGYSSGLSAYATVASTTGTSVNGTYGWTPSRAQIGSWAFRGVIYSSYGYQVHSTTYPVTVSFLNPTMSSVSLSPNQTNYYRTSTVTLTSSGTVTANSATGSQVCYIYSNAPSATGDSGQGYYAIGGATYTNKIAAYSHPGTETGTFTTLISLRGNNAANTWQEFATYASTTYTMQPFVIPTASRTVTYLKNNVYVGQTKFPIAISVTSINKSAYDTLTPTFNTRIAYNGGSNIATNTNSHSFAIGVYNTTLSHTGNIAVDSIINFHDAISYKDVNNNTTEVAVKTNNYNVLAIPTPTLDEITITLSADDNGDLTASINSIIDTDFRCYYTLYIESSDGIKQYISYSDYMTNTYSKNYTYKYNLAEGSSYKARLVCHYALNDETTVTGSQGTFYSETVNVRVIPKLCVKNGDNIFKFDLGDSSCSKPRLAIRSGNTMHYLPLIAGGVKNTMTEQGLSTPSSNTDFWFENSAVRTSLEDGYCRITNGGSAYPKLTAIKSLKPNTQYTIFTEIRRYEKTGTGNFYLRLAQAGSASDPFSVGSNIDYSATGVFKRLVTTKADLSTINVGLRAFTAVGADTTGIIEFRVMIIEGDYTNIDINYMPYIENDVLMLKSGNTVYQITKPTFTSGRISTEDGGLIIAEDNSAIMLEGSETPLPPEEFNISYHNITNNLIAGTTQTNTNIAIGDPNPKRKVLVFYNTLYASNPTLATEMKIGGQEATVLYNHVFNSYGNAVLTVGYAEIPEGTTTTVDIAWDTNTTRSSFAVYTVVGDIDLNNAVFSMTELPGAGDTVTASINALSGYVIAETSVRSSNIVRPTYDNIDIDGTGGATNISLIMGHKKVDAGSFETTVYNPSGSYRTFTILMSIG